MKKTILLSAKQVPLIFITYKENTFGVCYLLVGSVIFSNSHSDYIQSFIFVHLVIQTVFQ